MARRIDGVLACAVAVAGAALAVLSARAALPPFLPVGAYPTYDAAASPLFALVEPVAHAPWFGAATVPVAAVASAFVLCGLWAAGRGAGATALAATVTAAAFAARPEIGASLTLGAEPIVAVALAWASLLAAATGAAAGTASRTRVVLCAAGAAAALAVWPPAVVLLPVLVAAAGARGIAPGAAVAMAGVAGLAGGLRLWAMRASVMAGEVVSWADVWLVVTSFVPRGDAPFPWPPLVSAPLPAALALAGAVVLWQATTRRTAWLVAASITLLAAAATVVQPHPWRAEATRALYWASWPLVAIGLTWLVTRAPRGGRMLAMMAMASVLIGSGVLARVRHVDTEESRAFAAALAQALAPVRARGAAIVVEDTRVDTALVAWGSGAPRVARVRRDPALVAAALTRGQMVLVGPSARAALELWGFRFRPGATVATPAPFAFADVTGRFGCTDVSARWSELAGLDYTGRLGVHVPAGRGRVEVVVVGVPPLVVRAATADGRAAGRLTSGPGISLSSLPPVLWPGDGGLPDAAQIAARFSLDAQANAASDVSLTLGARAPLVAARVVGSDGPATICAAPLARFDPFDAAVGDTATIALDDDAFFAGGWHGAEGTGATAFRWTTGRARTLVPSAGARVVTLAIDARPAARTSDGVVHLRLAINGTAMAEQVLTDAIQTYTWQIPARLWVDGTNEVALAVSHVVRPADSGGGDPRELGLAVSGLRLRRQSGG